MATRTSGVAVPRTRRRIARERASRGDILWSVVFGLPGLVLFGAFVLYPLSQAISYSFYGWDGLGPKVYLGLRNYGEALHDPYFWAATAHTAIFAGLTLTGKIVLGLGLALLANSRLRAIAIYRAILFAPVLMSFVAVGLLWAFIYAPGVGLLNELLSHVGLGGDHAWLGQRSTALDSLAIVDIWKWTGYHFVLFLAALQTVRPDLLEAAQIDGAGRLRSFWHVTLPAIRPVLVLNVVIALAGALNVFDLIYVMTGGGPYRSTETVMFYMYNQAFQSQRFGYASSIACLLFLAVATLTVLLFKFMRSDARD